MVKMCSWGYLGFLLSCSHQRSESEETKHPAIKHKTKAKKEKHVRIFFFVKWLLWRLSSFYFCLSDLQMNSGGSSASERYEQLLTKARTLLMESKSSDRNDPLRATQVPDGDVDSSHLPTSKHGNF